MRSRSRAGGICPAPRCYDCPTLAARAMKAYLPAFMGFPLTEVPFQGVPARLERLVRLRFSRTVVRGWPRCLEPHMMAVLEGDESNVFCVSSSATVSAWVSSILWPTGSIQVRRVEVP
jgi:hypothetical protein